jgi:outer membrane protein assembly factor BamB
MPEAAILTPVAVIASVLVTFAIPQVHAQSPKDFIDHGVAASVSESRGAIATADAKGNPFILAMSMDTYAGAARTSLLVIDARTGEGEQFWYPKEDAPSAPNYCLMVASSGKFYVMLGSVFLEFDVSAREWSFAEDPGLGTAMSLAEDDDGLIYAATYPGSQLLSFDPKTRQLACLGRLDPVEQYPSYLACDAEGWVYAGIGTARANIAAIHVKSKERRQLVDESERSTGTGSVYRGEDGHVYGRLPGKGWIRLSHGSAEPVQESSPKRPARSIQWGGVYATFPDGSVLASFDIPNKTFEYTDAQGGRVERRFDYVSGGAAITSMALGPGSTVYGSTCHPFRLFSCDTATGRVTNLGGLKAVGGGNWCAIAAVGNTVYGAEYAGGRLYAFDTTRPWNDSGNDQANPRMVAQYKEEICRPRTALAHPNGRHVFYAGFAGYGRVGGGVGVFDIETGESSLIRNENLFPGHSTVTLKALANGSLVGGTSVDAPGGGHPTAKTAKLYIMAWPTREVLADAEPTPGARSINCLAVSPEGLVYGLTNTVEFFVFDPDTMDVVHRQSLGEHGAPLRPDQSLILTLKGRLLLLLNRALLEISPADYAVNRIAALPSSAGAGSALCDGRAYYGVGAHVWSCAAPLP